MAEGGDAAEAFDDVIRRLDPAMIVVTAAGGDERDGCLVGFHSQASIDPCRYVIWLSRKNRTFRLAQRSSHLAVHAVGEGDHDVAELFGGTTGDEVDKLAGVAWAPGPGGVPLLAALPVRLVGRILTVVDLPEADHVGFVLEPVIAESVADAAAGEAAALRLADATDIDAGHPA